MSRKPLIAGNWKMNGGFGANQKLLDEVLAGIASAPPRCDVAFDSQILTKIGTNPASNGRFQLLIQD